MSLNEVQLYLCCETYRTMDTKQKGSIWKDWLKKINEQSVINYQRCKFCDKLGVPLQKPYKCEVMGCTKRYTDPSSLRKHVKGHTQEEQLQYRRAKDLANQAKRSISPTTRYFPLLQPRLIKT